MVPYGALSHEIVFNSLDIWLAFVIYLKNELTASASIIPEINVCSDMESAAAKIELASIDAETLVSGIPSLFKHGFVQN